MNESSRVLRYLTSGGVTTLVLFISLIILREVLGLWYLLASTLAFCIALVTSFVLQKFWTFSDDPNKNILGQFSRFAIVSVCNLAINVTLMYISVDVLTMQYLAAQFIVTGLIAFFSFFIYRDLVFRRER